MSTPSTFLVRCPKCQREAQVDAALRGSALACSCGHVFVPATVESPTPQVTPTSGAAPTPQVTPMPSAAPSPLPPAPGPAFSATSPSTPAPQPRVSRMMLPPSLPGAMRLPERRLPLLGAVIGVPLGVLISALIAIVGRGRMVGEVFNLHSFSSIIPAAIMCMFFWGVLVCLFRWRRARAFEKFTRPEDLQLAVTALQDGGIEPPTTQLATHPLCDVHPLYRRMRSVLLQWQRSPGLHDADILLQKHEAADEDTVHAGYSLVRTFIWAMPVLGLIGTVIGISLAVGGFATFLGGNVEDVVKIKTSLVGVTSGLSFAFLITLEGLLCALLTMLPASALQAREEHLNTTIQRFMTDLYLPMLGKVAPESRYKGGDSIMPSGELLDAWREALKEVGMEVLLAVRDTAKTVLGDLQDSRQAQRLEAEEWVSKLGGMIAQINGQFAASTNDFLARLDLLREAMTQDRAQFQTAQQDALQAESTQHQAMIAALTAHNTALQQASAAIEQLVPITANALQLQESLLASIATIGKMDLSQLGTVIGNYTGTLHEAQARMDDFTGHVQQVVTAQTSLQGAVVQLHDLDFIATLTQFRETLARLTPLLKMLAKPQLVLVSAGAEDATQD